MEGLCQAGPLRSRVGAGEPAFVANVYGRIAHIADIPYSHGPPGDRAAAGSASLRPPRCAAGAGFATLRIPCADFTGVTYMRMELRLGDTPAGRPITPKPSPDAKLASQSFADGFAHTFHWADAA